MIASDFMGILKTFILLAIAAGLQAAPYRVTINTSPLSGDYQAYLVLIGVTGNVATVSDFTFGGGSPILPVVAGTGDMNSSVTLDNTPPVNPFFVDFAQNFTVGSTLSFRLDLTNNGPTPPDSPDTFAFALSTTSNVNLPTTDPFGTDFLFTVEFTGGPLTFQTYSTVGTGITAVITPDIAQVPEPAFGAAVAGLLAIMAGVRRFRRA
jgi:hypothetical protein